MTPINIIEHEILGLAVSGLELYRLITRSKASENRFADWFKDRSSRFDLVEGKDYVLSHIVPPGSESGRKVYEYTMNLAAARKIADWQPAKRGKGVLAYIREYERTGGQVVLPSSTQSTTDAAAAHSATSAISVLPEATQPKINFNEALPELEKLGPPNQSSPLPIAKVSTQPSPGVRQLLDTLSEPTLTPIQQLLQQAQQLADQEAKRDQIPNELFVAYDNRLRVIESKLNAVVFFFQQSANVLANIVPVQSGVDPVPPVGPPTQEQTTRAKIVRLVDAWVITAKTTHQETWRFLYAKLLQTSRFDVYAYGNGQKESKYLDIIEERGQLETLYTIADQTLRPK